jgi:hypothetical protein
MFPTSVVEGGYDADDPHEDCDLTVTEEAALDEVVLDGGTTLLDSLELGVAGLDAARPELLAVTGRSILDTMHLADAVLGSRRAFVRPRPPRPDRAAGPRITRHRGRSLG